ncbi:TWiK family of potassium channels protein 7-like [Acanthaster planci]|uniref:TWiK family of potassium channels protein 7-like n=1 Tax=Acanthaster planci TaxID=133434 RepID=A0A8B7YEJ2_ACAPL|nr:TWiK family of potassium channels protein 7-like [Acanthaster planci]
MSSRSAVCEDTVVANCCAPRLVRWLRGSLPVLLWTGYLLIGAAIFQAVEHPEAELRREIQANLTETTNRSIIRLFKDLLDNKTDTMNSTDKERMLTDLLTILKIRSYDNTENLTHWDFVNSALFCMTVVSTIGYGYLSPQTQLGRGLCILYALVGIPLNIIVMASAGKALARGSRSANGWLKRAFGRCAFWRKKVGPQTGGSIPPRTQSKGEGERSSRGRTHLRTLSYSSEFTDWGHRDLSSSTVEPARTHRDGEGDDGRSCTAPTDVDASADALHEEDSPAWVFVFLVLLYTCVFAVLMKLSQPTWTVLDGFYFIIITITTIGFGDLVTTRNDPDVNQLSYYFVGCLSIVIPVLGMILLSAGISIVISQFGKKTKEIKQVLCGSSKTQR